jgi:hypothetical protein
MTARRFPPPWSVEEQPTCFVARDHNGQALTAVYFEDEPGRRSVAKLLSKDEARKIGANYAERELGPKDVRGRSSRMNLIAVTAKRAKTKRSPYSRRLSLPKMYNGFCKK